MNPYKKQFNTWYDFFNTFLLGRKYFITLIKYLNNQRILNTIYPKKEEVFKCFELTNYDDLKVVIIGGEPNLDGTSNGLAFGINEKIGEDINPSLSKLEKVIENNNKDGLYFMDYSLHKWAKQGVLLLNSALTVVRGNKNSHFIYWKVFIKYLLIELSKRKTGIIYILLGDKAQSNKKYINDDMNYVFSLPHPDDLDNWNEDIFNDINEIIKRNNGQEFCIEW